jgi:hypothetical protein
MTAQIITANNPYNPYNLVPDRLFKEISLVKTETHGFHKNAVGEIVKNTYETLQSWKRY